MRIILPLQSLYARCGEGAIELIKRFFKYFKSLRIRFFVLLLIALSIGVGLYFSAHLLSYKYIDGVYSSEQNRKERERDYIRDLQSFVNKNAISSEHTGKLSEWAKENKYVYLLIYKDDQLFYTSDDKPEPETPTEPDAPEDPEMPEQPMDPEAPNEPTDPEAPSNPDEPTDPEAPDEEGGESDDGLSDKETSDKNEEKDEKPGGVTIDYPTREELFEYAKQNELYPLELADGTMLASLTEFTEYLYYDLANIISLIIAVLFVVIFMSVYFHRVTNRIIKLGNEVSRVAEGDMDHKITASGSDEIAELSVNVDEMRTSIVDNLRKEREAVEANAALITSMSHDIRTPLTVLLGYIDVMRLKAEGDPELTSYLKAAESTAMRLKKLSDDLFAYFLVFGGKELEIHTESYDGETIIEQMLSEHVLLMSESGYEVTVKGVDELYGTVIETDAQKLIRIFDNVFSNIYKYADKSYPVSISVSVRSNLADIVFKNKIMRGDNRAESNGIGLKTCKKLGEYLGAEFETKSEGDEFSVRLSLPLKR